MRLSPAALEAYQHSDFKTALHDAWAEYGSPHQILEIQDISNQVSTNRVFKLLFSGGNNLIAKISHYGTHALFREDHERIKEWNELLAPTRFSGFLAKNLSRDGELYTYFAGSYWVSFYHEKEKKNRLPRILSEQQIKAFAREMARFHKTCLGFTERLTHSSKSIKLDILDLHHKLRQTESIPEYARDNQERLILLGHCDSFLKNLDKLNYPQHLKIPLLIDWNIGNFSYSGEGEDFRLFSRWDYDWFRIDHPVLDLYFCSRVVSAIGDRTDFSYLSQPLQDERFLIFLREYTSIFPLSVQDVLFLKEAYRFFILNYVIRSGADFFRPHIYRRLKSEAADYLRGLEQIDFGAIAKEVGGGLHKASN